MLHLTDCVCVCMGSVIMCTRGGWLVDTMISVRARSIV